MKVLQSTRGEHPASTARRERAKIQTYFRAALITSSSKRPKRSCMKGCVQGRSQESSSVCFSSSVGVFHAHSHSDISCSVQKELQFHGSAASQATGSSARRSAALYTMLLLLLSSITRRERSVPETRRETSLLKRGAEDVSPDTAERLRISLQGFRNKPAIWVNLLPDWRLDYSALPRRRLIGSSAGKTPSAV